MNYENALNNIPLELCYITERETSTANRILWSDLSFPKPVPSTLILKHTSSKMSMLKMCYKYKQRSLAINLQKHACCQSTVYTQGGSEESFCSYFVKHMF